MIPEKEREALMRLTMCARDECSICKYKDKYTYEDCFSEIIKDMNILAKALDTEMSDDLISRQAAIEALIAEGRDVDSRYLESERIIHESDAVEAISMLPSAQQERKKGEWIKATGMMPPEFHGRHCCSECGNFANMEPPFGNREDLSKFCSNCGADMRGEQDGREG